MKRRKKMGILIQYIENPSKIVQLTAVRENGCAIAYIKNPSEDVQIEAIKEDASSIRLFENQTEKLQLLALKHNENCFHGFNFKRDIKNPTKKVKTLYKLMMKI